MPIDGEQLIIAPQMPFAEAMTGLGRKPAEPDDPELEGYSWRGGFYSTRRRVNVGIIQRPDGKVFKVWEPGVHHIGMDLRTMACSDVWGIEQEQKALQLLGTMIRHFHFKRYLLTGMFMERSVRSGVTYIFRRLKPTVALAPFAENGTGQPRILACLCQHPIAYYEGTWAGAMCPTDDVISHLTQMRGDEHLFWKRSNQHRPDRPEAGL